MAINAPVGSSVNNYKLSTPYYLMWKIKRLLHNLAMLRSVIVAHYFVVHNEKLSWTDNSKKQL